MKVTFGHARNDIVELTVGIVLNVIGGIFIGSIFNNPVWYQILLTAILLPAGIILEIRVLARHHFELQKVRTDIEKARNENTQTLKKMEKEQRLTEQSENKLTEAMNQIDKAKNEIEDTQKKAFSRSRSLADSKSLEDDIQTLHERLQRVEEKLGFSSFLRRRLGRHRGV